VTLWLSGDGVMGWCENEVENEIIFQFSFVEIRAFCYAIAEAAKESFNYIN